MPHSALELTRLIMGLFDSGSMRKAACVPVKRAGQIIAPNPQREQQCNCCRDEEQCAEAILHRRFRFAAMVSSHQPLHHLPMHVRQPEVAALEAVDEAGVVDAEAVEGGGLEVVDVDRVFDDVVAVVVGFAVGDARLDAAAGHPEGEAAAVVVAAVVGLGEGPLGVDGAAELAPQMTSVSSSRPRSFRSLMRAAEGRSTSLH